MKTFESYLEHIFERSPEADGVLDDDLQDAFEHWVISLNKSELVEYAQEYGVQMYEAGFKEHRDSIPE